MEAAHFASSEECGWSLEESLVDPAFFQALQSDRQSKSPTPMISGHSRQPESQRLHRAGSDDPQPSDSRTAVLARGGSRKREVGGY